MWTEKEKQTFGKLIFALSKAYQMDMDEADLALWTAALGEYPFEKVYQAIVEYMKTRTERPKIADIVRLIEGRPKWAEAEHLAEMAYREALEAASRIGIYQSVRFRDPLINATLRMLGGWQAICNLELGGPEEGRFRNEFINLYKGFLEQGKAPRVDYLPGLTELSNAGKYKLPDVIEVGEPRNQSIKLYEAETTVFLEEGRPVKAAPKPKQRKALPVPEDDGELAMMPEEFRRALKKLAQLVIKSMPEVEDEACEA